MFGCMISFGYYLALVVGGLLLGNAELYVAWAVSSPLYPSPVLIRFASAATCVPFVARLCTCHAATVHRYWEFLGPSLLVVTGMLAVLIIVKDEPAGAGTWRSIGCLPSTCVTHDGMQGIVSRLSTSQKRKRSERRRGHSGSLWSCQTNASKWGRWPCCELHSRRLCLVPCAHGLLMLQCGRMDSWLVLGLAGELPGRKRWHAARIPSVYRYHQCCVHLWHPGQYGWCVIVLCQMRGASRMEARRRSHPWQLTGAVVQVGLRPTGAAGQSDRPCAWHTSCVRCVRCLVPASLRQSWNAASSHYVSVDTG